MLSKKERKSFVVYISHPLSKRQGSEYYLFNHPQQRCYNIFHLIKWDFLLLFFSLGWRPFLLSSGKGSKKAQLKISKLLKIINRTSSWRAIQHNFLSVDLLFLPFSVSRSLLFSLLCTPKPTTHDPLILLKPLYQCAFPSSGAKKKTHLVFGNLRELICLFYYIFASVYVREQV